MTAPRPKQKPRRGPALSVEQIAREALALIGEGLEAFSFRRLAKRLNCEAMSIYHYYASKQHLVDAMVSLCLAEVDIPDPDLPRCEALRQFAHNYRAAALRHPAFATILVTHGLKQREGLDWLNRGISVLGDDLPMDKKAEFFRVFSYFISGAAIDGAMGYAKGPSAADPYPHEDAKRDFSNIMELGAYFGADNRQAIFDRGIDAILDWFERELAFKASSKTDSHSDV